MLDAENKIKSYIRKIYKDNRDASLLLNSIISLIDEDNLTSKKKITPKNWSQKNSFLITYADSIKSENDSPLLVLNQFCKNILILLIQFIFFHLCHQAPIAVSL